MNSEFDFGSEYLDYRIARGIEDANAPRSRAQRRREKKGRPPAPHPRWVDWTIRAMFALVGGSVALALIVQRLTQR